jgi:hypothetical protein
LFLNKFYLIYNINFNIIINELVNNLIKKRRFNMAAPISGTFATVNTEVSSSAVKQSRNEKIKAIIRQLDEGRTVVDIALESHRQSKIGKSGYSQL